MTDGIREPAKDCLVFVFWREIFNLHECSIVTMSLSKRSKRIFISIISVCVVIAGAAILVKTAQSKAAASACLENLALIDGGKQNWAWSIGKPSDATPTWDDICWYTANSADECPLRCPSGGTYAIGEVAHPSICSFHGFIFFVVGPSAGPEGYGIPGAVVETLWRDGHKVTTHSDALGRALVKAPENQTATVIISKPGYITISNSIESVYSNVSVALERAPK